jgi:small GTP-binding protein
MNQPVFRVKCVLVGDSAVGKTQLFNKMVGRDALVPQSTIGVDFGNINFIKNDKYVRIVLWDTSGQERFKSISKVYYRNCDCIIFVYDVTNRKSFKNIESLILEVGPNTEMILVGNKIDLPNRVVLSEEGSELAAKHGIKFIETSGHSTQSIEELTSILTNTKFRYQNPEPVLLNQKSAKSCCY